METKTAAEGLKSKREEILGKIEEGQTQVVRMGEKLKEEIVSTNKRTDKVNEDMEGYRTCVEATSQWQKEEMGFCKCQSDALIEEVQKLGACLVEQDQFLVGQGSWGSRLTEEVQKLGHCH